MDKLKSAMQQLETVWERLQGLSVKGDAVDTVFAIRSGMRSCYKMLDELRQEQPDQTQTPGRGNPAPWEEAEA